MRITKHDFGFRKTMYFVLTMAVFLTALPVRAQEEAEVDYVGPETVRNWLTEGTAFTVLDVRTPAEFVFVGHPVGALNIPLEFWDSVSKWSDNKNFSGEVQECLAKGSTVITLCRSGGRAKRAAEILKKIGFKSVFVFADGFEGPIDENGLRTLSGWKVNGLPYTYEGEPYYPGKINEGEEKPQGTFKDPE